MTQQSEATAATLALGAWSAIGVGAALNNGAYSKAAVALVAFGTGLLLLGVSRRPSSARVAPYHVRLGATIALIVAVVAAVLGPAGIYGSGPWLTVSHVLTLAATLVAAGWFVAGLPKPAIAAVTTIGVQGVAGVAMILSSRAPRIDDWVMLQAATRGLSRGQDIYTVAWTGPPHESSNLFAYLPGSAVLTWPFRVLFGDVRYAVLTALVATCLGLVWVSRRSPLCILACLPLLYPKALFGLEQSWIDPVVLLAVCATCVAVRRERTGWAIVGFGVALVCKQQAWLLLPLAMAWRQFGWRRALLSAASATLVTLPWAVVGFHRFFFDVFQYQLRLAPRPDSLSLFTAALARGLHPRMAWLVAAVACALFLSVRRLWRDEVGFLFAAAALMSVFNLMNKQSFFNEWALSAGLAAAAAVFALARPATSVPEPSTRPRSVSGVATYSS